jgi:hypothetical protein
MPKHSRVSKIHPGSERKERPSLCDDRHHQTPINHESTNGENGGVTDGDGQHPHCDSYSHQAQVASRSSFSTSRSSCSLVRSHEKIAWKPATRRTANPIVVLLTVPAASRLTRAARCEDNTERGDQSAVWVTLTALTRAQASGAPAPFGCRTAVTSALPRCLYRKPFGRPFTPRADVVAGVQS